MMIKRKIRVTIILGEGAFGDDPASTNNTVTLEGYRVTAEIQKGGLPSLDKASIRIYGLSQSMINKLTRVGVPFMQIRNNRITVEAGDDKTGMSQVFSGIIQTSFGDYKGAPDVALQVMAAAGILGLVKPVKPLSYPQGADVATIVADIAASMDMAFINHGVNVTLPTCYFPGTAIDQLRAVKLAANFHVGFTGGAQDQAAPVNLDTVASGTPPPGGFIEIWPINGSRGGLVPLISPKTGLVGYPDYNDLGVGITTIYQPGLAYGGRFNLQSSVEPACGIWYVQQLAYTLESEQDGGAWFQQVVGTRVGAGAA